MLVITFINYYPILIW